ncbi:sensor histidine kinase [Paenibacillus sp. N3.4]|uniref:sensor histidine kinase n=1 Tax=Paenibacillus sp. N3.4 TaxID=2603222 RepID=UPI0011CB6773|nr:ATP-binding protein [Paenibacillus sp. N3.4]TXK73832.1 hypothetical protein FU659_30325 [Paenibacillus sp. N3.4]
MRRKLVASLLVLSVIILQVWFSYIAIRYPVIGIFVEHTDQGPWVISDFQDNETSKQLGVNIGDIVVSIDGRSLESNLSIKRWGAIYLAESFEVVRGDTTATVYTKLFQSSSAYNVLPIANEALCFFMGFLIYFKARSLSSSRILSVLFFNMAIIYMSLLGSGRGDMVAKIIIIVSMTALPVVFLHFLCAFLKEKGGIPYSKKLIKGLYILPIIINILALLMINPEIASHLYTIMITLTMLFFIVGTLAVLGTLGYFCIKHRRKNDYFSMIVKLIWVTLFLSFAPFILLSFLPRLLTGQDLVEPLYTGWFITLFPLSFAYLILAKRLYDIEIFIRRILVAFVISIVPAAAITLLSATIFRTKVSIETHVFVLVVTIVAMTCLLYSLEYLTSKLEPIFFPRKYHLRHALHKLADHLGSIKSFRELREIVLVDIKGTLDVFGCAIVFNFSDRLDVIDEGEIAIKGVPAQFHGEEMLVDELSYFMLGMHEEYECYLVLTRKRNQTHLNREEIEWLRPIVSNLRISIENLYLIQKLEMRLYEITSQVSNAEATGDILWLRKAMFEIQEKERNRIAMDLHDSTMQDLFLMKRRLNIFLEGKEPLSIDQRKDIGRMMEHLDLINVNLRQNCLDLNPYLIKAVGLIQTINQWLDVGLNEFEVKFSSSSEMIVESIDIEAKKHLFRITQELVSNARKHSNASRLSIKLSVLDDFICLYYHDNGSGFNMKAIPNLERLQVVGSGGLGIMQIKSRVSLLNGVVGIDSKIGQGTKVTVRIPIGSSVQHQQL